MAKKATKEINLTTEEKIKEAARIVFTKKGYAAAKTRDIAQEAGINLALLNYYFRSKENLFGIIMMESAQKFFVSMKDILNDEKTGIEKKLELMIGNYIDLLISDPNFPLFMLSEIQANPELLLSKMGAKDFLQRSVFFKQLGQVILKNKINIHPLHYLMNIIGITVFPFIGKPLLRSLSGLSDAQFNELMLERKKLIPMWIKTVMKLA
jgi:AcrR family transcriptional regulator